MSRNKILTVAIATVTVGKRVDTNGYDCTNGRVGTCGCYMAVTCNSPYLFVQLGRGSFEELFL